MTFHNLKLKYNQDLEYSPIRIYNANDEPLVALLAVWHAIQTQLLSPSDVVLEFHSTSGKRKLKTLCTKISVSQFSQTQSESLRFITLIKSIKLLVIQLGCKENKTTPRDLYYKDTQLFQSQRRLNRSIELIESSMCLSLKNDFSIYPSQKGLVYGNFAALGLTYDDDPILIPTLEENLNLNVLDNKIIIVIEKDAVFQSFCSYIKKIHSFTPLPTMVVITAKGFPDRLSQQFVSNIARGNTISGFFDSDVYGINICRQYAKHCSIAYTGVFLLEYSYGWLDIALRDIRLMINYLKELPDMKEIKPEESKKMHRELTRSLLLFKKAEMNTLGGSTSVNSINEYIIGKVTKLNNWFLHHPT